MDVVVFGAVVVALVALSTWVSHTLARRWFEVEIPMEHALGMTVLTVGLLVLRVAMNSRYGYGVGGLLMAPWLLYVQQQGTEERPLPWAVRVATTLLCTFTSMLAAAGVLGATRWVWPDLFPA